MQTTDTQPDSRATWTPPNLWGTKNYRHPTPQQLRDSEVILEVEPGVRERIEPLEKLPARIERFLPPTHAHYDQYSDRLVRGSIGHGATRKCPSCFGDAHIARPKQCTRHCQICLTKNHMGRECPMVWATFRWWKGFGHNPYTSISRRPDASELAYLIVAGVVIYKSGMSLRGKIIANNHHPAVRKFLGLQPLEVEGVLPPVPVPASPPKPVPASPPKRNSLSPSLVLPAERQLIPQIEIEEMFAEDTEEMHRLIEEEEAEKQANIARADAALADAEALVVEAKKALKAARDIRDKRREEAAKARA